MTYKETVEWMFQRLPMYQQVGVRAYKNDLSNILELTKHLGNPEKELKCIHVAGTNGKGSTSSMLASILMECGYKVGLFTSPHLLDYRERIRINGNCITESFVVKFIHENKTYFEERSISFFEMSVGMAFAYFKEQKVEFAIIEVGLGGRLDATNVITPLVSVITNIGFDHMNLLGNTLESIATEKAGIIKKNTPVVIGEYLNETKPSFEKIATQNNTTIHWANNFVCNEFESDLKGSYQSANQKTVLCTLSILKSSYKIEISESAIALGMKNVMKNSGLRGRWQVISESPKIILDTAHNEHGLRYVLKQLLNEKKEGKLHFIIGFVNDKNIEELLSLFPKEASYYFTQPNTERAQNAGILKDVAENKGLTGSTFSSVQTAYHEAISELKSEDVLYIGGSTFVVADFLHFFKNNL
jgi:dihydrofolate synthase / folylpolyglutamate synthase